MDFRETVEKMLDYNKENSAIHKKVYTAKRAKLARLEKEYKEAIKETHEIYDETHLALNKQLNETFKDALPEIIKLNKLADNMPRLTMAMMLVFAGWLPIIMAVYMHHIDMITIPLNWPFIRNYCIVWGIVTILCSTWFIKALKMDFKVKKIIREMKG